MCVGDIMVWMIGDMDVICYFVLWVFYNILENVFLFSFVIIIMVVIDWKLMFVFVIVMLFIVILMMKMLSKV